MCLIMLTNFSEYLFESSGKGFKLYNDVIYADVKEHAYLGNEL